jgi:hypothetical protein
MKTLNLLIALLFAFTAMAQQVNKNKVIIEGATGTW